MIKKLIGINKKQMLYNSTELDSILKPKALHVKHPLRFSFQLRLVSEENFIEIKP